MKREVAQQILNENCSSYDQMAKEFSGTRDRFWNDLAFLAEHATPGMEVLDIGCGNGRFFPLAREREVRYTGLDNSKGLLDEARGAYPDVAFVEGDATALPFPDRTFDIAFSFATIHHIPGRALRAQFVKEAARVLKPGSTFIVTAWDLSTPKYRSALRWSRLRSMFGLSRLDAGDVMLTFGKKRYPRYVHGFTLHELEHLLDKNGFAVIGSEVVKREPQGGKTDAKKTECNLLVVARKKSQ